VQQTQEGEAFMSGKKPFSFLENGFFLGAAGRAHIPFSAEMGEPGERCWHQGDLKPAPLDRMIRSKV
jgi:hypothetical protein